jgi:hypothetical protein
VRLRVRTFERVAPFVRSGALLRWRSLFLTENHTDMVRALREDLLRYLPEITGLPDHRRQAIELVTSFEAWDRLRSDQKLGRDRAQTVVERTLLDLLGAGGGGSGGRGEPGR